MKFAMQYIEACCVLFAGLDGRAGCGDGGESMNAGDEFYDDDVTSGPLERWQPCNGCDGSGSDWEAAHAPSCDGNCRAECPIQVQVQCPSCDGAGLIRVA